jgi:hypothetical protein
MKTFENGLSKELCSDIYNWAISYYAGRENLHQLGFPMPVVTKSNASWNPDIVKDSKPVIIYFPPDEIVKKIKEQFVELKVIDSINEDMSVMVFLWTAGSYIPLHSDGNANDHRKVFTSYLNPEWSVEYGGIFNYLDKNDNQWKILVPSQGLLVYNDTDEPHFTTPVNEKNLRVSLQIFTLT